MRGGGSGQRTGAGAGGACGEEQLAALVSITALINTYNRMNLIIKQPAGDYQPGQLG